MRQHRVMMSVTAAAAVTVTVPLAGLASASAAGVRLSAAQAAAPGGTWGTAIKVPGLDALNAGEGGQVVSVSCPSAGDCTAGGGYLDISHLGHAFVVSERNGHWGKAIQLPGTAALARGGDAGVTSVSCASAGNCAAAGFLSGSSGNHAFVASERNGHWRRAIELRGIGVSGVDSVSCASAGNCAAGGGARNAALVVSELNGRWGPAVTLRGTGRPASVISISCASAGNCAAGGGAADTTPGFVVSERNGRWGKAILIRRGFGLSEVNSVSCASAGNCVAGGDYLDRRRANQAFVISERNGRWGKAIDVPGTAALNTGGMASVASLSCTAAGNCSAGGYYIDHRGPQAFVVSERNGHWGKAIEVPGTAALNTGANAQVSSVSCASPGNCAAGGDYEEGPLHFQAFVASERNGHWAKAIEVPGTATLNTGGNAVVFWVSCGSAGSCAAGGRYTDSFGRWQPFLVNEKPPVV